MSRFITLALLPLFVGGCAASASGAACLDYRLAHNVCSSEAYGDDSGTWDLVANYCDVYDVLSGPLATDAEEMLACGAKEFRRADCSTVDGFNAALGVIGTKCRLENDE